MPRISVIIPAYNAAPYLKETLQSVIAQTYKDWEIVVVDDGSTDHTKNILQPYISRQTIRYYWQKNQGVAAARNLALAKANGEIIAFLDADDLWLPYKLEKQLPLFRNENIGLTFSDAYYFGSGTKDYHNKTFYQDFKPPRGKIFKPLLLNPCGNFIGTLTVMVRNKALQAVSGFNENLRISEDFSCWLKICYQWAADYVSRPLAKYRVHAQSLTQQTASNLLSNIAVREEALQRFRTARNFTKREKWLALYSYYLKLARWYLGQHQGAKARDALRLYQKKAGADWYYWYYWLASCWR